MVGLEKGDGMARQARDVMKPSSVVVTASTTLRDAATRMRAEHVDEVIVLDDAKLVGIVSTGDIAAVAPDLLDSTAVKDAVREAPASVTPESPVEMAAARMLARGARRVVILDYGRPVGIVSVEDLVARW